MREILFRGKCTEIGRNYGNWIYGYLGAESDGKMFIAPIKEDGSALIGYFCDPDTISEYTGLTDKNGKKIFEGDIVYYQCSDVIAEVKIGEYRDTVSHKDAYGCYVEFVEDGQIVQDVMNHMESDETYGSEVIGNIYDNPELLPEMLKGANNHDD